MCVSARFRRAASTFRPGRRAAIAAGVLLLPLIAIGCESRAPTPPYLAISGVVTETHTDAREFRVRVASLRGPEADGRDVFCVVGKDSELYVDDALSPLAALAVGQRVDLIGYRDPNPRLERFIVTAAYVNTNPAPVAPPALGGRRSGDTETEP